MNQNFKFFLIIFIFASKILMATEFKGKFSQGAFILGITKPGSMVLIDEKKIRVSNDGHFVFGLDRDRKSNIIIKVIQDGNLETFEKKIVKRKYIFKKLMDYQKNKLLLLKKFMKKLKKTIS